MGSAAAKTNEALAECRHHWTVTSPCPFCQTARINELEAALARARAGSKLYLLVDWDKDNPLRPVPVVTACESMEVARREAQEICDRYAAEQNKELADDEERVEAVRIAEDWTGGWTSYGFECWLWCQQADLRA